MKTPHLILHWLNIISFLAMFNTLGKLFIFKAEVSQCIKTFPLDLHSLFRGTLQCQVVVLSGTEISSKSEILVGLFLPVKCLSL